MGDEEQALVESFSERAFAEAAAALLESEDIATRVVSDDAGGELPNLDFASGVKVLVAKADLERARLVLRAASAGSDSGD